MWKMTRESEKTLQPRKKAKTYDKTVIIFSGNQTVETELPAEIQND